MFSSVLWDEEMQSQPQRVVIWSPLPLSIIKSEDCAQNLFRWPFHPRHIFVKDRTPGIRGLWGLELTCLVLQRQNKKKDPVPCINVTYWLHPPAWGQNLFLSSWPDLQPYTTPSHSFGRKDQRTRIIAYSCLHVVWSSKNTSLGLVFTAGNDQIRLLHIMGLILRSSSEI